MNIFKKIVYLILGFFYKIILRLKKKVIFKKGSRINLKCKFEGHNKIGSEVKLSKTEIGYGTYIAANSKISNTKIGRFCSIGPNIKTVIGRHPTKKMVSTHPAFFSTLKQAGFTYSKKNHFEEFEFAQNTEKSIIIGNDVWVGSNVLILEGLKIGDGSIIAAGAVVTKNIEPYSIVGGVPAKFIKYRFNEKYRDFLLNFKWWNKDISWIENNADKFLNIKTFYQKNLSDSEVLK